MGERLENILANPVADSHANYQQLAAQPVARSRLHQPADRHQPAGHSTTVGGDAQTKPGLVEKPRQTPEHSTSAANHSSAKAEIQPENRVFIQDMDQVWDAVLKELIANGKRSVHACIAQGKLVELNNTTAVIAFTSAFPKERTQKEDYRTIIENMIAHIIGRELALNCILASEVAKQAKPSSPTVADSAAKLVSNALAPIQATVERPDGIAVLTVAKSAPESDLHALTLAKQMFGGKVIKNENPEEG